MYSLVSLEMIKSFLLKFNIDFDLFNAFEQSVVICLCNIFFLLFWIFVLNIIYKIFVRIYK